ncbi:hypothetical protein DFR72_103634 [Lentzea flaviverrucosa]|uniref:Uncharacterized protein n=1 Tax=Lentzea flaviverrucosa TaxID=200379 RepID=A0A1H8ZXZ8_9PSEU|nr:hypothetical protein DFR72_103634 [Lentzea flaviverrucosa]SEP68628.1 hypothetical protein SAMN05216195_10124 [Lentzea flaviverrucosa]
MKRRPLVAAVVAVVVVSAVVGAAVWIGQANRPASEPTSPVIHERVSVRPLETTIELSR